MLLVIDDGENDGSNNNARSHDGHGVSSISTRSCDWTTKWCVVLTTRVYVSGYMNTSRELTTIMIELQLDLNHPLHHITTMGSPSPQPEEPTGPVAGSPSDFLKNIVGKMVKVRIGSGVDYHGEGDSHLHALTPGLLTCLDGYMNVALEETEEWSNGRLTAKYGDTFLRGNNGEFRSCSF
jgi:U6 snRNA-associated Sm-like protein LSm6